MTEETILRERDGPIATVVLNRPDKLNAINLEGWRQLGETMAALSEDEGLRCVVLRGAGDKAFAAGADIGEFATARNDSAAARVYGETVARAMRAVAECRHPTVALIKGVCVGGGLEIACCCDLRICGESGRFGIPIAKLGLVMAHAELEKLIDLVGRATALEILFEARVFGAAEAKDKGLVNRVVPDDDVEAEAYATAGRIAAGAPLVARWHKKFARRLADPAPLSEEEIAEGYACCDTEDYRIGYRSFLEKMPPVFKGV